MTNNNIPTDHPDRAGTASITPASDAGSSGQQAEGTDMLSALHLSSLLASRLCHDLVNPVGALSSGLEVLDEPGLADDDMRDAALDLVRQSAEKSVALLKFARIAYGAGGAFDSEIPFDESRDVLDAVYRSHKADLEWDLAGLGAPKDQIKVLLTLAYAAGDFAPRGGTIRLSGAKDQFRISVKAPKLYLNDQFTEALEAEADALTPKQSPIFIAAMLTRRLGGDIVLTRTDPEIALDITFASENEDVVPTALTVG
ncbi:MAG: histidine phosphotransferase family protein [Pseudomonadota bacterium]